MNKIFNKIDKKIYEIDKGVILNEIPVGVWNLSSNETMQGVIVYLEELSDLTLPKNLFYDKIEKLTDRFIKTYNSRAIQNKNTGVLLCGLKGTGKTLQMKHTAIKSGLPILMVNKINEDIILFLQKLEQKVVIIIDEFEKKIIDENKPNNNSNNQNNLLSLLDGIGYSNKLFIFTANDKEKLSEYIINRTGRIYYFINYEGLSIEEVKFLIDNNLKNKKHEKDLLSIAQLCYDLNYDVMSTLINELNEYEDSSVNQCLSLLNINLFEKYYIHDLFVDNIVLNKNKLIINNRIENNIEYEKSYHYYENKIEKFLFNNEPINISCGLIDETINFEYKNDLYSINCNNGNLELTLCYNKEIVKFENRKIKINLLLSNNQTIVIELNKTSNKKNKVII